MKRAHGTRLMVCLSLLMLACKSSESAANEIIKYEEGDVSISIPTGWKAKRESEKLIVNSQTSSVTMMFFAPAERGMEAGMAMVDRTIKHRRNGRVDIRSTPIADKMKIQNYHGTGDLDGRQTDWIMTLVDKDTFEEPRLAVLTTGKPDDLTREISTVMTILKSLKRIH